MPERFIELGPEAVQFFRYGVRAETFEGIEDRGERKSCTKHEQTSKVPDNTAKDKKISRSTALSAQDDKVVRKIQSMIELSAGPMAALQVQERTRYLDKVLKLFRTLSLIITSGPHVTPATFENARALTTPYSKRW